MTRWIGKRGLWGVVTGTAVAAGSVLVAAEPGDVVVFKEGNKDRKITVTKVNKRADKSLEVHGKDAATGEVVVWVEGESNIPPAAPPGAKAPAQTPATPAAAKDTGLPKAKARAEDPMGAAAPMPETAAEKERRLFNGRLFGRDPAPAPAPAANPAMPQIAEAGEPKQKTSLLNRLFGKKAPAPVPAAMPGPAITTSTPAPPPVTKSGPAAAGEPKVAPPARPAPPVLVITPPAGAPAAGVPVPMPLPASRPPAAAPVPVPTPLPSSVPVPVPLPTIPSVPPGAQSLRPGEPVHVVLPVGFVPAEVAMAEDLRPYAAALKDAPAPSVRLLAAKGLADGRHGSTDAVKGLLFAAAQHDPAATVRAGCVDHLVRLGYHHPGFVTYLRRLADGPEGEERDAARAGLSRMTPRTW